MEHDLLPAVHSSRHLDTAPGTMALEEEPVDEAQTPVHSPDCIALDGRCDSFVGISGGPLQHRCAEG